MKAKKLDRINKSFIFLFVILNVSIFQLPLNAQIIHESQLNTWEARLEYARLLRNLKRFDESLIQYQTLLEEKPESTTAQIEMAEVLYYQGHHKESVQLLEKVPANELNDKTKLLMADIYQSLKEYAKSESIYREYLKKNPDDSLVKLKLAEQLSWDKRYEESIFIYRQLLQKFPDDIQLRRKYGLVLMWMGNEKQAAQELEKTLNFK